MELCSLVSKFARAAIKKYHKLSGLNNRSLLSHSSGGWKSDSRCPQGWFLLRAGRERSIPGFPLWLDDYLHVHMIFSLYTCLSLNFPFL